MMAGPALKSRISPMIGGQPGLIVLFFVILRYGGNVEKPCSAMVLARPGHIA